MNRAALLLSGLIGAIMVFTACGGGTDTPSEIAPPPPKQTTPPPPTCVGPTLEISMSADALRLDPHKLEAGAGTEVAFCFSNDSGILHKWVLVQAGAKDAVAARGSQHQENGWVKPEDPDVIARTKLLAPGQEVQMRFTAPPAGVYCFVCTFPGHNFTMFGDFVVTP